MFEPSIRRKFANGNLPDHSDTKTYFPGFFAGDIHKIVDSFNVCNGELHMLLK